MFTGTITMARTAATLALAGAAIALALLTGFLTVDHVPGHLAASAGSDAAYCYADLELSSLYLSIGCEQAQ